MVLGRSGKGEKAGACKSDGPAREPPDQMVAAHSHSESALPPSAGKGNEQSREAQLQQHDFVG
jgi:hypothetical protein